MRERPAAPVPPLAERPLTDSRILIVDDDADVQHLLRYVLGEQGFGNLVCADSATEAERYLSQADDAGGESAVDLILMDVHLPDADGIEAVRAMRRQPHLEQIPILMVTGTTEEEAIERAFAAGANDYIAKPVRKPELLARIRSALLLRRETARRAAQEEHLRALTQRLEAQNALLQQLSLVDGMTGIANRRALDERLACEWALAARHDQPLSIVIFDLDRFKAVNDTYGHQVGDACLQAVAAALEQGARRATDLAARYGGEEFALILPGTPLAGALQLAEDLRAAVAALDLPPQRRVALPALTVSAGVATAFPAALGDESGIASLMAAADRSLYYAKRAGRNRVADGGTLPAPEATDPAAAADPGRREFRRVLLADDAAESRSLVRFLLRGQPYTLDVVENGQAAVARVQGGGYDLVLMDVQMPVLDGVAATAAIRAWERQQARPALPIVALTANASPEEVRAAPRQGFSAYLTKPIQKATLLAAMERCLADPGRVGDPSRPADPDRVAERDASPAPFPSPVSPVPPAAAGPAGSAPDGEMVAMIHRFLASRQEDVTAILRGLAESDYALARRLGHNMKGCGASYGFQQLSVIGARIEQAARDENEAATRQAVDALADFLRHVQKPAAASATSSASSASPASPASSASSSGVSAATT